MTYNTKTIYPIEESFSEKTATERKVVEFKDDLDADEAIKYYGSLQTKGYSVSVSFIPPEEAESNEEKDAFAIAKNFESAGIPYKATLKLKAKGDYESMVKVAKIIEQQGFDYSISAKLDVNENSTVDFEKESSWFDTDYAKYSVLPKISSQDILDLRSVYDALVEENQKVSINIRGRVKKDDDDVFANQLVSYPDNTLVVFRLSDADIYGD